MTAVAFWQRKQGADFDAEQFRKCKQERVGDDAALDFPVGNHTSSDGIASEAQLGGELFLNARCIGPLNGRAPGIKSSGWKGC